MFARQKKLAGGPNWLKTFETRVLSPSPSLLFGSLSRWTWKRRWSKQNWLYSHPEGQYGIFSTCSEIEWICSHSSGLKRHHQSQQKELLVFLGSSPTRVYTSPTRVLHDMIDQAFILYLEVHTLVFRPTGPINIKKNYLSHFVRS